MTTTIVVNMARGRSFLGCAMSSTELLITANPVNAKNVSARLPRIGVDDGQLSIDSRVTSAKDDKQTATKDSKTRFEITMIR